MTRTPLAFNERGEGWHFNPKRRYGLMMTGVAVFLVFGIYGLMLLSEGRPVPGVLMIVFALCLLAVPFHRSPRQVPPRLVELDGERGLLLPTNSIRPVVVAAMGVLGPLLGTLAIAGSVVAVKDGDYGFLFGAALLLAVSLLFLGGSYGLVKQHRTPSRGLFLRPVGPVLRTRADMTELAWDDIGAIRPHWARVIRGGFTSPGETINNWFTFEPKQPDIWPKDPLAALSGTKNPTFDASLLALDPQAGLALCQFYLDHPETREELATDASLARVDKMARA